MHKPNTIGENQNIIAGENSAPRIRIFLETKNNFGRKKNKGHKHRIRGMLYNNNVHIDTVLDEKRKNHITEILHKHIPREYITRETKENIYILCPFHEEKTGSLSISKNKSLVKCFGCGKGYPLSIFLSMSSGKSVSRWNHKLYGPYDVTLQYTNQTLLFSEELLRTMLVEDMYYNIPIVGEEKRTFSQENNKVEIDFNDQDLSTPF